MRQPGTWTRRMALAGACALAMLGSAAATDTVKAGVYITDVYGVDLAANQLMVDCFVWFACRDTNVNPLATSEVMNAREVTRQLESAEYKDGVVYRRAKYLVRLKHNWDLRSFPLDRHRVELQLEDSDLDTSRLVYALDSTGTGVDKGLAVAGWRLSKLRPAVASHTWRTTFGGLFVAPSGYPTHSRLTVAFTLSRSHGGWGTYVKCFQGLLLAVLLSLATFYVDPRKAGLRFGLCVAGVLVALANLYLVNSFVAGTPGMALVHVLHTAALAAMAACVVLSLMALRLEKGDVREPRQAASVRLDRAALRVIAGVYAVVVVGMTVWAMAR